LKEDLNRVESGSGATDRELRLRWRNSCLTSAASHDALLEERSGVSDGPRSPLDRLTAVLFGGHPARVAARVEPPPLGPALKRGVPVARKEILVTAACLLVTMAWLAPAEAPDHMIPHHPHRLTVPGGLLRRPRAVLRQQFRTKDGPKCPGPFLPRWNSPRPETSTQFDNREP